MTGEIPGGGGAQQAAPASGNGTAADRNAVSVAAAPAAIVFDAPPREPAPGAPVHGTRPLVVDAERKLLYAILAVVLTFLMAALTLNALHLANVYANAETFMRQEVTAGRLHPNTALHHLDGVMAAHMIGINKSAALTLSFVVVVLGALLVVKGAEASYELKLHGRETKSELVTSSPGLVMITLALGLALAVILHTSEVSIFTKGTAQEPGGSTTGQQLNQAKAPTPPILPPDEPAPSAQAPSGVKK